MDLLDVTPSDDGKKTVVRISVSLGQAERLLEAFALGQLDAFGITRFEIDGEHSHDPNPSFADSVRSSTNQPPSRRDR